MIITKEYVHQSAATGRQFGLDITYNNANQHLPVVLFVHGFKGFKDWGTHHLVAKIFAEHGFAFIKFNLSLNGFTIENPHELSDTEAFGNNNFSIEMADLQQVIDYVKNNQWQIQGLDTTSVSLMGHSRGGALAILKAAEEPYIGKLVTWAAVADLARIIPANLEQWKASGVFYVQNTRTGQQLPLYYQLCEDYMANKERFSVKEALKRIKSRLYVFHGTADTTVPVQMAAQLLTWRPDASLTLIEKADHVFGASHPYTENLLPAHLEEVVSKSIMYLKNS